MPLLRQRRPAAIGQPAPATEGVEVPTGTHFSFFSCHSFALTIRVELWPLLAAEQRLATSGQATPWCEMCARDHSSKALFLHGEVVGRNSPQTVLHIIYMMSTRFHRLVIPLHFCRCCGLDPRPKIMSERLFAPVARHGM